MSELELRKQIVEFGRSLFERGYTCGTSGNLSVRLESGFLVTPTNISLGALDPSNLSVLDAHGTAVSGSPPTKETWLHLAMYRARPQECAIVHLHSTYATALSCLTNRPKRDVLPALTPYAVMRLGRVALVPYGRPGDASLSAVIENTALDHHALLLANHGPIVGGRTLAAAVSAAEELEETARLYFTVQGHPHRLLTTDQVDDLRRVFT
jgi:ribulose-5-phosphate 4-epimerase/fuculose-1-phosphate aldolase